MNIIKPKHGSISKSMSDAINVAAFDAGKFFGSLT